MTFYGFVMNNYEGEESWEGDFADELAKLPRELKENERELFNFLDEYTSEDLRPVYHYLKGKYERIE